MELEKRRNQQLVELITAQQHQIAELREKLDGNDINNIMKQERNINNALFDSRHGKNSMGVNINELINQKSKNEIIEMELINKNNLSFNEENNNEAILCEKESIPVEGTNIKAASRNLCGFSCENSLCNTLQRLNQDSGKATPEVSMDNNTKKSVVLPNKKKEYLGKNQSSFKQFQPRINCANTEKKNKILPNSTSNTGIISNNRSLPSRTSTKSTSSTYRIDNYVLGYSSPVKPLNYEKLSQSRKGSPFNQSMTNLKKSTYKGTVFETANKINSNANKLIRKTSVGNYNMHNKSNTKIK